MEQQKQQILSSAEELFLRYGIKSVTMDDLAQALGISKKTLYQYVENKADLISQIVYNHVSEERNCISEIVEEEANAIEEMLRISQHVIRQMRKISPAVIYDLEKYYKESWEVIESLHRQHVYEIIVNNIEKGIRQGLYRPEINRDIIAKFYVEKTFLLVDEKIFPLKEYNREELLKEFIYYHLFGIATMKGIKFLEEHRANIA